MKKSINKIYFLLLFGSLLFSVLSKVNLFSRSEASTQSYPELFSSSETKIHKKTKEQRSLKSVSLNKQNLLKPVSLSRKSQEEAIPLGIKEVIYLASSKNLNVQIQKSKVNVSQGEFISSTGDLFPSIDFNASFEDFEGGEVFVLQQPNDVNRTTYRAGIFFNYPIQLGGKAIFQAISGKKRLEKSVLMKDRVVQEVIRDSVVAYFNWLGSNSEVELAKQSLLESKKRLEISELRFETGFSTKLEVAQNSTLKAEQEALLIQAQNNKRLAETELLMLLNLSLTEKVKPKSKTLDIIDFFTEDFEKEEALDLATKNRLDLKELNYLIQEAKANKSLAIADFFPTLNLSSYYRGIGDSLSDLEETKQVMASLNIDILKNMGVKKIGGIKSSKAKLREAILSRMLKLQESEKQVLRVFQDFELYKQLLEAGLKKLSFAKDAYRIAQLREENGQGINLEVLEAYSTLLDVRLELEKNIANYNNSQINLLYEIGLMNELYSSLGEL